MKGRDNGMPCTDRGLLDVRHVIVPRSVIAECHSHLRAMGRLGCEGVAFWAGEHAEERFMVRASVIPAQHPVRDASGGVAVVIDGEDLFQMNKALHRQRISLVAQLHSHPGRAYHSETDDAYSIVTRVGGLSIVVPDFGHRLRLFDDAAVYRLEVDGTWASLSTVERKALLVVEA